MKNKEIIKYFLLSKILLITSFYDSSPNILHEALHNNCIVITSKNIGSYEYLDKKYLVNNYSDVNEWIKKILDIITELNSTNKI